MSDHSLASNAIKVISAAIVIVLGYIGIAYFGASLLMLLIMAVFMLLYVLLPGSLIIEVSGIKCDHISTFLIRSFFVGFALSIVLYFIAELTGEVILYAAGPVLSVAFIIIRLRKRHSRSLSIRSLLHNIPAGLFLFVALVFAYSFLTTQCTYIPPYEAAFSTIKLDFGFHAGIINALSEGYPPDNPWVAGRSISYHLFTEMLYSIPVRLFGIHSEEILLSCTPYIITPVLSCALYSFFREFMADGKKCSLYCLSLMLSNMFILKSFPSSWFLYHLFSNINNAGMGAACMLTAFPVLKTWDPDKKRSSEREALKDVVMLAVLIMLTTGIKGPVAAVLVSGIAGTVILGIIMRKLDWRALSATAIAIAAFASIYVYVIGAGDSQTGGKGGDLLNPWEVTDIFFLKGGRIMDLFPQRSLSLAVVLLALILISLMAFAVPFIIGYIRELFLVLSGRKGFSFSKVSVYASCMTGYLAMLMFNFSGHSQVYFGFASLILVPAIAFWYMEDLQLSKSFYAKAIKGIFILCLCLSAMTVAQDFIKMSGKAQSCYEKRNEATNYYRSVSTQEYEALVWLRENTDEDALIASDRYYSVPLKDYTATSRSHNTHFAYAIYSDRDQYLEGSGFSLTSDHYELRIDMIKNVRKMTDPEYEDRGDLARSLDVDYVLVSKRFDDTGDLSNEDYDMVFTNDEVDIYKIAG